MAEGKPAAEFTCSKCQIVQDVEFEYFDVECCHVCYACLKEKEKCPMCSRDLAPEEREMIAIYNEVYYEGDLQPPANLQV